MVDLALRHNPATRRAWASARAAAAALGTARGAYFPQVDAEASVTRVKTIATGGRVPVVQTFYGPSATLSWLLFDVGGRGGSVEAARQALLAADWTHNATIADVVLQAQVAYYTVVASDALVAAQAASLKDAETNLAAAEERRRVGVATVADVLQARTAVSQARLALEQARGDRQTARGALAVALGFRADLAYEVDTLLPAPPIASVADSVDAVIARAIRDRPDLAAARAQAAEAQARVREARGQRLPSLFASGTGGFTYIVNRPGGGSNYNFGIGLSVPLFNGFAREFQQRQAEFAAEAAAAQARSLEQAITFQVFSAYYALQTATRQVEAADDLLASATQAVEVTQARYRAGVGSLLDLLAAQTALADARAQRVQAQLSWYTSLAQLAHDAGALDARGRADLRLTTDTLESPQPR